MPVIKAGESKDSLQALVDRQSRASPDTIQIEEEEDAQNDTENQENEL